MNGNIYISKPCHENWNRMTQEEQGRHCTVCDKVVKDFNHMSNEEILNSLKSAQGSVCGRVNASQLTPASQKQKIQFWAQGFVFKKAIYPIMALLGIGLFTKKVMAQGAVHHPVKGKMHVKDYYTGNKEITLIIRSKYHNQLLSGAQIQIFSGINNHPETLITGTEGKVVLKIAPEDLTSDSVGIEIYAAGYRHKNVTFKIIKDVQTIEITMEEEFVKMGEISYKEPQKQEIPELEKITTVIDSSETVEVIACSPHLIKTLPFITPDVAALYKEVPVDKAENENPEQVNSHTEYITAAFQAFPVPATHQVTITSDLQENFNLDVFDANGKKVQTVINSHSRYVLDVSAYASGVYFVLITVNGQARETKKIIVSH